MCDYSLMGVPNRLAVAGEELLAHRFPTGSMGMAAPLDVCKSLDGATKPTGFLAKLNWFFNPPQSRPCTAVCIAPGARLLVRDIPEKIVRDAGLQRDIQEAVFTQTGAGVGFRDAIRFTNGFEISLQRLTEGQRVRVLSLSSLEESSPVLEEPSLAF